MSAFVCELCFQQAQYAPIRHPSDRLKVSLDVMTADGGKRIARVQLANVCRVHAEDIIRNARAHPKDHI